MVQHESEEEEPSPLEDDDEQAPAKKAAEKSGGGKKQENADDDMDDEGNVQLKSKNGKAKANGKKAPAAPKKGGKTDEMWDDIIDTLSDDRDFMQDTIKESEHIDGLYG